MQLSREKIIILLTVFVDVLGFGIVVPILPYYVQSLSASPTTVTLLFSVFSLCAFFSSPIIGVFSDKYGRRPALITSIASTALGWFVFAAAGNVFFLFLGRIIDGLAAGNFPVAQSYMADLSHDDTERTHNMGLIGAIFGIGFIVGPGIGALLSHVSMAFPFWVVGVLATLNTLVAWIFLPETNTDLAHHKKISLNPFAPIVTAIKDVKLRVRYLALFLFGLALAVQYSIFALFTGDMFGFGPTESGFVFVGIGLLIAINQGVLLKRLWLKHFSESRLEVWTLLIFALAYWMMSLTYLWIFIIGLIINVFAQSILRAVFSSRITGFADPQAKGEVAGIMMSILTLGTIIGPLVVGSIYVWHKSAPFIISGGMLLLAFVIMYLYHSRTPESQYHHEDVEPVEVI